MHATINIINIFPNNIGDNVDNIPIKQRENSFQSKPVNIDQYGVFLSLMSQLEMGTIS